MKIISIDNFDRETTSDELIAAEITPYWGQVILESLEKKFGPNSEHYFKLVPDDHKLRSFET